ncbi:MAG: DUF523 domain-containing protein [Peptoclostridium sp.]|uniref:DUF523 domain-containing protein n=1 Tax=Peptoclostridium sp. TaxID=1904860 RepID=UPI00139C3ABF|nr:DUF523 domain-containing protein [Peptoclostridium sp.]MZQ74993.1 DUF523 domain-containing protein [Peptoclostridium sp.]
MYIISSCLAGISCRYDGKSSENQYVIELVKQGNAMPVCPELLGGLPVPRTCCEIIRNESGEQRVVSSEGQDFTREFAAGAEKTLEIARIIGATKAILKSKSPSCGCGLIYDGTFSGRLIEGNGLTAELLMKNGIEVINESDL